MDLNSLKPALADEGAVLELVHPNSEEAIPGMTITLMGHDSAAYRKITLKKQQALLSRLSKGKKAIDYKAEQIDPDTVDELVALTVGWTGFEMKDADGILYPLEATPDNCRTVYTEWKWIREQAQEFVSNRAHFFR
jgi:hypothetical protein